MIPAHIIFEGVDRCGKSSLVDKFCVVHRPAYFKMRVPTNYEESTRYYYDHVERLMNSMEPSVWDRGLLSELVYGPLYRPQECLSWYQQQLIDWTMLPTKLPVLVVYVYPLYEEIMLQDERPNANRLLELEAFNVAFERIHWRKVAMTKHTIREGFPAWKNRDESWYELERLISIGLGEKDRS